MLDCANRPMPFPRSLLPLSLGLLLVVASPAHAQKDQQAQPATSEAAVIDTAPLVRARRVVQRYLKRARTAWLDSEHRRVGGRGHDWLSGQFGTYVHCHANETRGRYILPMPRGYTPIAVSSAYGLCPTWMLMDVPDSVRETARQGAFFTAAHADSLAHARDSLRTVLQRTLAETPDDQWILGQYIRFLVYDSLYAPALKVLASCGAEPWLCAALTAYVYHEQGDDREADAHFARALSTMAPDERCGLTDIGAILPLAQRKEYLERPCDIRHAMAQRHFWLADPAWTTSYNERRATHMARRIAAMLHTSGGVDERYDWTPNGGGPTVQEMIQRYGWPALTTWIGVQTDTGHSSYLEARGTSPLAPYSSAEYDGPRVAFDAPGLLFLDETRAADTAWTLTPPEGVSAVHERGFRKTVWWPFAHMRMPGTRVVQFTQWQMVTFRRQTQLQIAAAVDIAAAHGGSDSASPRHDTLTFLVSPEPDVFTTIATTSGVQGASAVLSGRIAPISGVLSFELQGTMQGNTQSSTSDHTPDRVLGRVRRGYRAPGTLDDLGSDSIALSDPVLFRADGPDLPRDVDAMLPHMLPGVSVARDRIGLFWETYGVPASDSVQFTIAVTPRQRPGFLRRAVAALKLMAAPYNGVAVGWQDPAASPNATGGQAQRRGTPILSRAMYFDLSKLSPGEYVLEISATDAKQRTALASRVIQVR